MFLEMPVEEMMLLSLVLALNIACDKTSDEVFVISDFFALVATNLLAIANRKAVCEKKETSGSTDTTTSSNKTSGSSDTAADSNKNTKKNNKDKSEKSSSKKNNHIPPT